MKCINFKKLKTRQIYLIAIIFIGVFGVSAFAETNSPQGDASPAPAKPLSVEGVINRLWDIPQELLLKSPSKDLIQNESPPFFTYVPNANYPAAQFESTTLPSTQVNFAKYSKSPIKNDRQQMTEIPGVIVFTSTALVTDGFILNTSSRGESLNYMLDGIPLARYPRPDDASFFSLPPMADIERIDSYNNASTSFGSNGFNMVNYITRNPTKETEARFKTNHAVSSTGEYGTNSSVEGTVDRFGYLLSMNHNQNDGVRHNADFSNYGASAKFVFDLNEKTLLTLGYLKNQYEAGNPGSVTSREYEIDRNIGPASSSRGDRQWNDRDTGYMKLNQKISETTSVETNVYGFIDQFTLRNTRATSVSDLTLREASVLGGNSKLSHTWEIQGEKQLLNIGGNFSSYKETSNLSVIRDLSLNDTRGARQNVTQLYEGGIFLENQFRWEKLTITPGARLDVSSLAGHDNFNNVRTVGFMPIDRVMVDVIPKLSLAASYEILNRTELFFNVMQDHNPYETSSTFSPDNSNQILSGNYSLERFLKYEGGVRGKIRPWSDYSASLFVIDHDNVKGNYTRNGVTFVEDNARYYTRGAEAQLRVVMTHLWQDLFEQRSVYEPSQWGDLALSGNISILDAQQEGGNNPNRQVPFSPDFLIKGGVYYNYQNRLTAGLTGLWIERYFTTESNLHTTSVAGYMVWDYNMEYWVIKDHFKLMAGVHNLFDEDYYTRGYSAIQPAPERTYYVGAGVSF